MGIYLNVLAIIGVRDEHFTNALINIYLHYVSYCFVVHQLMVCIQ